ncbi:OmpP1/FadL family transporter [Suttonella sp. R2A3]|uniref:OmpP1/FadL family transporter n=1 Tax=Suttonella sp. R2A3 TaxID=2908648 RepID=UPI001F1F8B76|nr:OmpP1/FadL family transporter [Suttonella sp. R2A3]UJF25042.1 OmpP1/FadL family transporter [Suttonella sp. R2A3]
MQQFRLSALSLIVMSTIAGQAAFASGYHFGTQSIAAQSTSNASSAEADSPATIFYNPAGLSHLKGTQVTANVVSVFPSVKYSNAKGKASGSAIPPTERSEGKITDPPVIVPHIYASHEITPQLTAGLGIYVPFGTSSSYEDNSVMRYSIKSTDLATIDINPTIAYDFGNGHSVAVGVIGQYMDAELQKNTNIAGMLGAPVGSADIGTTISGDDWGIGYNLGWMWDINDSARIGLSYRSKIKHTLEGSATKEAIGPAFAGGVPAPLQPLLAKEKASVDIVTPESLSLHGMVKVDPQLDLFADVTWTKHSRFDNLDIELESGKKVSFKPNWRDTYKVALGAAYQLNDQWQLRGGVAYDKSPVRGPEDRLATMPDNDRIWLSLGAKYDISEQHSLNFAYSYLHIKDASVDYNDASTHTTAKADYNSSAHILGLQYTYRF